MTTIRIPVAAVASLLLSLGAFFGLSQLISVPFDMRLAAIVAGYNFTPQIRKTTIEYKRDPKITRKPPPVTIIPDGPGWTDTDVTTAVDFDPPTILVDGHGKGGLPVGTDRDVLPLVRINPDYPPRAAAAGTEGWVQVRFNVTAAGSVRDAVVVGSEPGTVFDDAALTAIARWRYNPRVEGGVAVERVGLQTVIRFELEN